LNSKRKVLEEIKRDKVGIEKYSTEFWDVVQRIVYDIALYVMEL